MRAAAWKLRLVLSYEQQQGIDIGAPTTSSAADTELETMKA
jgi:hypothetical protein